jgi:hypothetical protein
MDLQGGITRLHKLQSGDAVDRRRLDELYRQAAQRANEIFGRNIANDQFSRVSFQEQAIQEFWYNSDRDLTFNVPHNPATAPGSAIQVRNDDSFTFGELTWTLRATAATDQSVCLIAWPVFDSKALWAGEDFAKKGSIVSYAIGHCADPDGDVVDGTAFSTNDKISLGGSCSFVGLNGRMLSGVLVHSFGHFRVQHVQLAIRSRAR